MLRLITPLLFATLLVTTSAYSMADEKPFTYIEDYQTAEYNLQINSLIEELHASKQSQQNFSADKLIEQIFFRFQDKPYIYGGRGEGKDKTYGQYHIQQNPVYRTDGFDCFTFVEVTLALLHAKNLNDFTKHIHKIGYGGAKDPRAKNQTHFFNRNHFVSADLNPALNKHAYTKDITTPSKQAKFQSTTINKKAWFNKLASDPKTITLIEGKEYNGRELGSITKRLRTNYYNFINPAFLNQSINLSFIPKQKINSKLLAQIKMPAIVEVVRDDEKWIINEAPIKQLINSGIAISHIGIAINKQFKQGDLIYRDIHCEKNKDCVVTNVQCEKQQCEEIMLLHATDAYPNNYIYSVDPATDKASCAAPPHVKSDKGNSNLCNRVVAIPLLKYIGQEHYQKNDSILGLHFEQILS